ncbi:MAG: hypothetical protein Q9164_005744 [Protoblastenia rupestris]
MAKGKSPSQASQQKPASASKKKKKDKNAVTKPANEESDRTRCANACAHCAKKKCKCSGIFPCLGCVKDNIPCIYGKNKRLAKGKVTAGRVQLLEFQNDLLRTGLQQILRTKVIPEVEPEEGGRILTHKILQELGVLMDLNEWYNEPEEAPVDSQQSQQPPQQDSHQQQEVLVPYGSGISQEHNQQQSQQPPQQDSHQQQQVLVPYGSGIPQEHRPRDEVHVPYDNRMAVDPLFVNPLPPGPWPNDFHLAPNVGGSNNNVQFLQQGVSQNYALPETPNALAFDPNLVLYDHDLRPSVPASDPTNSFDFRNW